MHPIVREIVNSQRIASLPEAHDFCKSLCQVYSQADPELRHEIRNAVAANDNVRHGLLENAIDEHGPEGFLAASANLAKEAGDYANYVRTALLVISITDGFEDSRDTLMWLAELWHDAESHGIDPAPIYTEIGRISSTETIHAIGAPTAGMILQMLSQHRRDQLL